MLIEDRYHWLNAVNTAAEDPPTLCAEGKQCMGEWRTEMLQDSSCSLLFAAVLYEQKVYLWVRASLVERPRSPCRRPLP